MSARIAVLASGRGSNLQALLEGIADGRLPGEIVGVFSDKPAAPALRKVPPSLRWSTRPRDYPDRCAYEQALGDALAATRPDWIVCAGYMRILGDALIQRFHGRMLNIHPSLLPKYKGLHTHARAIEAGDTVHGASVHFVVPELDAGSVIAQVEVPVLSTDSPEVLAARLLPHEHQLLVAVLGLACTGRLAEQEVGFSLDDQPRLKPLSLDSAGNLN